MHTDVGCKNGMKLLVLPPVKDMSPDRTCLRAEIIMESCCSLLNRFVNGDDRSNPKLINLSVMLRI